MDQLNFSFWFGLALAIPIGIFVNLVTPSIGQWWAKRNRSRSLQQTKALKRELLKIEQIAKEPGQHQVFLLEAVLLLTLLTSAFGVMTGLFFALSNLAFSGSKGLAIGAQFTSIFGGVLIAREVIDTLRRSKQIKNIDKYREEVATKLKELGDGGTDA
ncbi:MAG: hypothetical protein WBF95_09705 [Comamonas thiooxydans]